MITKFLKTNYICTYYLYIYLYHHYSCYSSEITNKEVTKLDFWWESSAKNLKSIIPHLPCKIYTEL